MTGRLARTLLNGKLAAGEHELLFDGTGLASGIHFVRVEAGGLARVQKMAMVK